LDDRDVMQAEALAARILRPTAARWQGIPSQLCQALIRGFAFIGVAQEAPVTRLSDHEEVFARVTRLLAAVVVLLVLWIGWAVDRTFGAIMPNRGVVDLPPGACVSNIAANSAAVRAGSRAWAAKA